MITLSLLILLILNRRALGEYLKAEVVLSLLQSTTFYWGINNSQK